MKIKRFAVIGYPLGHSLSPVLHPFLLNEINEAGIYERIEVTENLLHRTLETLGADNFVFQQLILQSHTSKKLLAS